MIWQELHLAATAPAGSVLFLLGLIVGVASAVIASFAWIHIAARSRRPQEDLDFGPDEDAEAAGRVEPSGETPESSPGAPPPAPWERPADWWRREP